MQITPYDHGEGLPLPERAEFKERRLPKEPKTDVGLDVDAARLRERMLQVESDGGFSVVLTHTQLDANDEVIRKGDGSPDIGPRHEIVFTGENLARLGTEEAVEQAIQVAREEAAAKAKKHFEGLALGRKVLASRLGE